jgi:hypothetical protein
MKKKNESAQKLVALRWAKTTKKQRSLHMSMMGKASVAKKKGVNSPVK